jgi:hypothetical protein
MCTAPDSYHAIEFTEVKQHIITEFIFQSFVRIRTEQAFVEFNTFCSVFLIVHRGPHFAHRWFKHLFIPVAWYSIFGKLTSAQAVRIEKAHLTPLSVTRGQTLRGSHLRFHNKIRTFCHSKKTLTYYTKFNPTLPTQTHFNIFLSSRYNSSK